MQVPRAVRHDVRQVRLDEDVQSEALVRLLNERESNLLDDTTASAIAPEEEAALNPESTVQQGVMDLANDDIWRGPGAAKEGGAEAELPALVDGAAGEDGLEESLGKVDVGAGARSFVVTLVVSAGVASGAAGVGRRYMSLWVVAPGVHAGVFLAGHGVAPARMSHVLVLGGQVEAGVLKPDVPQAFWVPLAIEGSDDDWVCRGRLLT